MYHLSVSRETGAAFQAHLCSQYGRGATVEPIAPVGSNGLSSRRAFVVSHGMKDNGLHNVDNTFGTALELSLEDLF